MSDGIELEPMGRSAPPPPTDTPSGGLGRGFRAAEDAAKAAVHFDEAGMDAVSTWGVGAAGWFATLAIPLLLFPRILIFFAQVPPPPSLLSTNTPPVSTHYDTLTPLESFLTLSLALGLISLSLITLFILVPTYTSPTVNPGRLPLLVVLVGLVSLSSVISWNTGSIGGLGKVVALGNGLVGIWGWWVLVFGLSGGYRSKKTGADKRTSAFPFYNSSAASVQKKEWKKSR